MEVAALLVAGGRTLKETAAKSGVAERTLRRWLAGDAAFLLKLRQNRTAIFAEAVGRLTTLGGQAAAVLGALLTNESAGIRLRAASAILQHLAPGYRVLEEREVRALAEKVMAWSKELDEWQQTLKAQQQQLDERLRANGVGGLGHGR
jgi:hypothetical protein